MRSSTSPLVSPRPRRIVLLGPTGAGKSTQAELLGCTLGVLPLCTGDIFRGALAHCGDRVSSAMQAALDSVRRGESVPDHLVMKVLNERSDGLTCAAGFLLEGFPRTVAQAEALDHLLLEHGFALDAVIAYELPAPEIMNRLTGRRTCPSCQTIYHLNSRAPTTEGICDHCHTPLVQRDSDRLHVIRARLAAYNANATPLIGYYRARGVLLSIAALGSPQEIFTSTLAAFRHATSSRPPMSAHPFGGQTKRPLYRD